ncbi:MAG: chemotaxis protein CheC [Sterolibacterium sp.]|jgi:chemotaxis protein CheC|nr:chemotaxis protein CheC [Sterolibacterium sp.]
MTSPLLNEDQQEALQEIANIGMGQAGASIAQVLDHFVRLSIPRILFLQQENIAASLRNAVGENQISAVRQAFHSSMRGEALVVFGEQRCNDLADLMGYEQDLDRAAELELLLDITNILVGACLGGIAEQLREKMRFSPPSLMADRVPIEQLLSVDDVSWNNALLVEVNFSLEQRNFACHLLILMTENEIKSLASALDRFLENY